MKRVFAAFLCEAALTFLFFYALIDVFPHKAVERFYLGTYGLVVYVLLLPLIGYLITWGAKKRTAIICSVVIPALFILSLFIFTIIEPDFIKIPVFNQYREYNESVRYGVFCFLILPICCLIVFPLAYIACLKKDNHRKKASDNAQNS